MIHKRQMYKRGVYHIYTNRKKNQLFSEAFQKKSFYQLLFNIRCTCDVYDPTLFNFSRKIFEVCCLF